VTQTERVVHARHACTTRSTQPLVDSSARSLVQNQATTFDLARSYPTALGVVYHVTAVAGPAPIKTRALLP
jgi:hypothetical protein